MDWLVLLQIINRIAAKLLAAAVLIHFAAVRLIDQPKQVRIEQKVDAAQRSIAEIERQLKLRMEDPEQWNRANELLRKWPEK
jgi:hypothetical protein